jgi:hypothetical protein
MRLERGAVPVLFREVLQYPEAVGTVAFPVGRRQGAEYRPGSEGALLPRDSEPLHWT